MSKSERQGLTAFEVEIYDHWREFRPKMVKALRAEGKLIPLVKSAAERTMNTMWHLEVKEHMPHDAAWELVREMWAFLPEEKK